MMMSENLHRKRHQSWLIWILVVWFASVASAGNWMLVDSVDGKKVTLKVSDKKRIYYQLDKDNPIVVKIADQSELKLITRMVLPNMEKEGIYSFVTRLDGEKLPLTARATEYIKSTKNPKKKKQRIGQSRTIIFDVPPSEHEYSFSVSKESRNKTIYIRFLVPNHDKKDITYIAYLPRTLSEEVRIIVKEREYIYYRSTTTQPIELDVIGPTRVKCISRLEIDHSMRGSKPYRVQVTEGNEVIMTNFFNAQISGTTTYAEKSDMVLGRGETLFIDVPQGGHRYQISTPDQDISVIFRFYLPEKDLGNESSLENTARAGLAK